MTEHNTDSAESERAPHRADCDNPLCEGGYDSRAGMDHWFQVTEFAPNELTEWGYCSRECMLDHQPEVSR